MRKFYAIVLAVLCAGIALSGCNKQNEEPPADNTTSDTASGEASGAVADVNSFDFWVSQLTAPDEIVMSESDIAAYNTKLHAQESLKCTDMASYPKSIPGKTVQGYINETTRPTQDRYIGAVKATPADFEKLEKNANAAAVPESVTPELGYMIQNTILRAYPTAQPSYEMADDIDFDLFNDTMLKIFEPVAVLHTSADGAWAFIQSESYRGWLPNESVALLQEGQSFDNFFGDGFAVVTGNRVYLTENAHNKTASNLLLYMGTRLPLANEAQISATVDAVARESGTTVLLPVREANGTLSTVPALIPINADISVGFLPYTRANVLRQGEKLLGDRLGWSGQNQGRDASAMIRDIYSVFGFSLPRNTSELIQIPGEGAALSGLDDAKTAEGIGARQGADVLLGDGYVGLYLGQSGGAHYALNALYVVGDASGSTETIINSVVVTDLSTYTPMEQSFLSAISDVKTVGK